MSKYVCLECGEIFDENEIDCWEETHGLDYGPYEPRSGCPYCGGAYVEAYRCDGCGEYINTETYVEIDDQKYCEGCFTIRRLEDL
jgi:formylmethanofuran dehydrogenase subunit E